MSPCGLFQVKELFADLNVTCEVVELDLIGKHDFTFSEFPGLCMYCNIY